MSTNLYAKGKISFFIYDFEHEQFPYKNVHSFRHLNVLPLINNGVNVRTVSAALGHAQTSTTLNIYAHAFAATQAKAPEAVASSLNFKRESVSAK